MGEVKQPFNRYITLCKQDEYWKGYSVYSKYLWKEAILQPIALVQTFLIAAVTPML